MGPVCESVGDGLSPLGRLGRRRGLEGRRECVAWGLGRGAAALAVGVGATAADGWGCLAMGVAGCMHLLDPVDIRRRHPVSRRASRCRCARRLGGASSHERRLHRLQRCTVCGFFQNPIAAARHRGEVGDAAAAHSEAARRPQRAMRGLQTLRGRWRRGNLQAARLRSPRRRWRRRQLLLHSLGQRRQVHIAVRAPLVGKPVRIARVLVEVGHELAYGRLARPDLLQLGQALGLEVFPQATAC
mmetsp:Transcript_18225/g.52084  ORF Transcript_18225/g.52084 Transcript_18225/m.52084 type:complete len:243 (+) Transcript_18225:178-906(+)